MASGWVPQHLPQLSCLNPSQVEIEYIEKNNNNYNSSPQTFKTFGYTFTYRDKLNPKYEIKFSPPEEIENSQPAKYLPTLAIDFFWGKCVKLH